MSTRVEERREAKAENRTKKMATLVTATTATAAGFAVGVLVGVVASRPSPRA